MNTKRAADRRTGGRMLRTTLRGTVLVHVPGCYASSGRDASADVTPADGPREDGTEATTDAGDVTRVCVTGELACEGQDVLRCAADGVRREYVETCDGARGSTCVEGRCETGCEFVDRLHSNLGCEFWAVDLDNAVVAGGMDASAQPFAVVVVNPSPSSATVGAWVSDAAPGSAAEERLVDEALLGTNESHVFNLGRREVDGTRPDGANDGSHTALTANAFRIRSTAPVVVYQFNPFPSVDPFSTDASLLLPTSSLGSVYTALGWPQTVAHTPGNPDTDLGIDLRAFLAVVGSEPGTRVRVTLAADIVPLPEPPPGAEAARAGQTLEIVLGPYEVLNLETGGFDRDPTGTRIEADAPVAVFSGSEASDVPCFRTVAERLCCAEHLEEQLLPDAALGRTYVVAPMPARSPDVAAAGGDCEVVDEPEYVRILAVEDGTEVRTHASGVAASYDGCARGAEETTEVILLDRGDYVTRELRGELVVHADKPIALGQFVAGQSATGMPPALPGGDPVFIQPASIEGWRSGYFVLTPDTYPFDYLVLVSDSRNDLELDGAPLPSSCRTADVIDPDASPPDTYRVYRCALSRPVVLSGPTAPAPPDNVVDGEQNDGVHELRSRDHTGGGPAAPFGVLVYGFGRNVGYGYAGGVGLR